MDVYQDDPEYRAAVLTGRARALSEMAVFMRRLAPTAPKTADAEARLQACMSNWLELVSWLNQAALEAEQEIAVFHQET